MKKEVMGIAALFVLLLGGTFVAYQMNSSKTKETVTAVKEAKLKKDAFIYFYGATCPHCKELAKWLKEEGIDKEVKYQKLEVWSNPVNASLMEEAAGICKVLPTGMGVPFVYDNGKCYIGVPEAQKIFTQKLEEARAKKESE